MDTLLLISIVGAAIDVLPWFAYDISENGQRAMIRVIRLRTVVEDTLAGKRDETAYIEGCEAVLKAREYYGREKKEVPRHKEITAARREPAADKAERAERVKAVKTRINEAREFNEELEIADFVTRELNRFDTEFGRAQLALCGKIVAGGPDRFFENAQEIIAMAHALPQGRVKEEKVWRKQEVRNARATVRSAKLAAKFYPEGVVPFDPAAAEAAYDLPDDTKEQARLRRRAMKEAAAAQSLYSQVAYPYLTAERTVNLYEGYQRLDELIADYGNVKEAREKHLAAERAHDEELALERKYDRERAKAEKKLHK
jgi:hypothetical protein